MTFREDLRKLFPKSQSRAIDKTALWGSGADTIGTEVHAGVPVSQANALQLVAVYACVRILAETIASLPADVIRKVGEERQPVGRSPGWLQMPNPETTWFEFVERVVGSLNIDGNAFILITARDPLGFPTEFFTLHPRDVVVRRGPKPFLWSGTDELTRFGPSNPMGDVLHIKAFSDGGLRGLSPIDTARQAIGLGLVAEKFGGRFFGRGQQLSGIIELPAADATTSQDAVEHLAANWKKHHGGPDSSFSPGILTGGAQWKPMSIAPENAQFLETRKFQVIEIARLFRVPPHLIQELDVQSSWGTGVEQQSIGFVRYSLLPWLVRLEASLQQLLPRGQFVKFNVKGLLRGDAKAEAEALTKMIQNGVMNRAQAARLLDLPVEDPELEKYLIPSNLKVVGEDVTPAPAFVPVNEPEGANG